MISQSEIERVKAEIRKQDDSWLKRMDDNVELLCRWLKKIVDMYRLSIEIITQTMYFLNYIRGLMP